MTLRANTIRVLLLGQLNVLFGGCNLPLGDEHSPSSDASSIVDSRFVLSYRLYYSRKAHPKRFEDLTYSNWFQRIERRSAEHDSRDYSFRIVKNGLLDDSRTYLDLDKASSRQDGDDGLSARFLFYMNPVELVEGKTLTCSFGYTRGASGCEAVGVIAAPSAPTREAPQIRNLTFLPGLFPNPPLTCTISFVRLPSSAKDSPQLLVFPSLQDSPEAKLSLAFAFECFDNRNKITAVQGYFLQNSPIEPQLGSKADSIQR